MTLEALIIYICTGCLAGLFSGLLGISGGVVTVPLLLFSFSLLNFPEAEQMHMALGTSLAAMVFNSLSSTLSHYKKNGIVGKVALWMIPGILMGSLLGSWTAYLTPDLWLQAIFGTFLLLLGIYFLQKYQLPDGEHRLPTNYIQSTLGMGIGYISSVLGIGGGVFLVPMFSYYRLSFPKAIGTSALLGMVISFMGALSYLLLGRNVSSGFPYSYSYIYLPAFLIVAFISFFSAKIGAKLSYTIPVRILRKVFALLLFMTGASMILRCLDL